MIRWAAAIVAALCLTAGAGAGAAAAALSAPQDVESLYQQSTVSAYGQLVVWSRYDPVAHNYRLVAADVGDLQAAPQVLPIAPRAIAFDVDLGPGPDGRTQAVYSRCQTEPDGDYYGQKLWPNDAAGCDIYSYDFATATERKLTNLSSPHEDEFLPTIWRGQVAFARAHGPYVDGQWRNAVIYSHSLAGSERSRRQSQGPTTGLARIGLTGIDLFGRRLAFTRRFVGSQSGTTQMRVTTLGSASHALMTVNSGLTQLILRSPQFHHGRVLWVEQCAADPGGCNAATYRFWSSTITTGKLGFLAAPQWLGSAAFILDSVWWMKDAPGFGVDGVNACQGSDPPDPAARCQLQRAFVTF